VGNFLIKQVAEDLGREFPRLKTFATLSPIPGFGKWLRSTSEDGGPTRMSPKLASLVSRSGDALSEPGAIQEDLRGEIFMLCARYLLDAKRGHEPLDSVARFHLANGARLERLNWMGDSSPQGLQRSLGLMVNYAYRLADVERNHEAYARYHRIVASRDIQKLVKRPIGHAELRDPGLVRAPRET
jgi:malonyl-CoA decarboxylase